MNNWKQLITALFVAALLALLQGCSRAAMEHAIALGEQPKPGSLEASAIRSQSDSDQLQCKVLALGEYCLGGDIEELLATRTPFRQRETGGIVEYDFRGKYRLVTTATYDGKIMTVSREERPANWRTLLALKAELEKRYGDSEDLSSFPEGVESKRGRQMAIYSHQGESLHVWERGDWRIELRWQGRDPIRLTFEDTELMKSYQGSQQ